MCKRYLFLQPALALTAVLWFASFCRAEEIQSLSAQETEQSVSAVTISETILPAMYDAREAGKAPAVRSQGTLSTCWALTAVSALEAAWMPDEQQIWSADHMSLGSGFAVSQDDGGDYKMIMAYLAGWRGPVLEQDDPYGDGVTDPDLSPEAHVQEMILMNGYSEEKFKEMIFTHGPVQTSLTMNRTMTDRSQLYYNPETFAFYDPDEETVDHDVLIIGWDDSYSRENFMQTPDRDGAWICQNTWGEDFGDQGIFYVSYEDANAASAGLCYSRVDTADNYDAIYQTDDLGWQGRQGYDRSFCYFANVFTAEKEEYLEAVGFYSTGSYSSYEVYLVTEFEDTSSFDRMQLLTEGTLQDAGYFTVDLPEPVLLEGSSKFAVVVNIDTEGSGRPVAVELKKDRFTAGVTLEGKEGYISLYAGEWENTEDVYQTNVCLKAYTGKG